MNLLLLTAHSIAEHDDVRMFSDMGIDVFSIGAYTDPAAPGDSLRPALSDAPWHPELADRCVEQRERHGGEDDSWAIDWAKADLHQDIVDWADVVVAHHYLDRWIVPQWERFAGKRVIWRTCGQSDPPLERLMSGLRGLEIVRYSPAEKAFFDGVGWFAGEDQVIRFGKYAADYGPWIGDEEIVANVTQDMWGRGQGGFDACGLRFWLAATEGLPAKPAGPNSERLPGGVGALSYEAMLDYLRHARTYLYTGTVPASYTLGLIEAMLSGVPVVSIGAEAWQGPPRLFEAGWHGADARSIVYEDSVFDDPADARRALHVLLEYPEKAAVVSRFQRSRAIDLFGVEHVSHQWALFLGAGHAVGAQHLVGAEVGA